MNNRYPFFSFLISVSLLIFNSTFAQAPFGINYQAVARDISGNPISSQTIAVQFKIWKTNPPPSGTLVYDVTHASVTTNQFGLFNLVVGTGGTVNSGTFSAIVWASDKFYLEVLVDPDAAGPNPFVSMGTTQFVSVPYAFHAHTADSVKNLPLNLSPWSKTGGNIFSVVATDNVGIGTTSPGAKLEVAGQVKITGGSPANGAVLTSDAAGLATWQTPGGMPAGIILPFAGATSPTGFLICDGTAVSRTTYSILFNAIGTGWGQGDGSSTFNLPDLRGRFLRGVDGSAGNDPDKTTRIASNPGGNTGNSVGSLQADNFANHTHALNTNNATGTNNATATNFIASAAPQPMWSTPGNVANTVSIQNTGGSETRPKNVYVNYIIKY